MEIPFLKKKSKSKKTQKRQIESIPLEEKKVESVRTERTLFQIPGLQQYTALMKLRIVVSTIFILCTFAMILIFANGYMISAVLLLIGYVMLFILLLKLFRVRKL